jgi:hypothetical protein
MQSEQAVQVDQEVVELLGQVAIQHLLEQLLQQVAQVQLGTLAVLEQQALHHYQQSMADKMVLMVAQTQAVQVETVQSMWSIGYEIIRGH